MNLCFIIEWILWTVRSVLGVAVGKDCWEIASAHADFQLVFFVYYLGGVFDVFGHHFFKVGVQAVVEIAHDNVIIAGEVWVEVRPLVFERLDDLFHHVVTLGPGILAMDQVAGKNIKCLFTNSKVDLNSSFIWKLHACHGSAATFVAGFDLAVYQMFQIPLDESNIEYFPHVYLSQNFEIIFLQHEDSESFHEISPVLRFLERTGDKIMIISTV